jgi:hypothetical protein
MRERGRRAVRGRTLTDRLGRISVSGRHWRVMSSPMRSGWVQDVSRSVARRGQNMMPKRMLMDGVEVEVVLLEEVLYLFYDQQTYRTSYHILRYHSYVGLFTILHLELWFPERDYGSTDQPQSMCMISWRTDGTFGQLEPSSFCRQATLAHAVFGVLSHGQDRSAMRTCRLVRRQRLDAI